MAYTSYDYHTLPLDRVTWESGPGKAWVGKGIKNDYFFNIASPDSVLSCKKYSVTDGGGRLLYDGYYKANSLSVVCNTDEDGYRSYTFKDSEGRVLLVRSCDGNVFSDTYFVYDSFGRLCYVLPPSYQENEDLDLWAYQYSYDGLGRCIKKKYPGCDEVSYVYDNADRIICSEDGVQHSRSHYTAYAYDVFGRLTSTTEMTRGSNGGRDLVNSCLRKYYDNYDFLYTPELSVIKDSLDYCELPGFGIRYVNTETPSASSCGLLTGTSVDVDLPGESFRRLYAVFYYDRYGNVIQKCSTNLLGGFERDFYSYTFTGKVASRRHVHTVPGKANCIYAETYSYDSLDRLVRVTHQQDNAPAITLFENVYDSLGRLSACVYHGVSSAPVTYSYNIRGWLTGIRHPLFSQMLYYTDGPGRACYNGNISSMSWKSGNEAVERGYKFMYDGLSRLSDALYGEGPKLSVNINRFNEQVTGYDKMGNILGLKRYGQTSATGYDVIDDLSLSYAGNRLKKVADRSGTSTFNNGFEFKDGIDLSTEYEYDENGNLTKDLNKNITAIQYNCLNLPSRVMFANGNSISYLYDAAGRKLRTVHVLEGDSVTTDYCGNVVYENGVPQILLTEVGYVSLTDGKYHYYLKDHQGNNRVVVAEEGTVEEVNDYYAFGGLMSTSSRQSVQPYKYNGKELDRKGGLDWYDYGARMYDAVLGRWHAVDPMSEKYYGVSPYLYCANNPILLVDPNGMWPTWRGIRNGLNNALNTTLSFTNGAVRAVTDNILLGSTSLRETGIYSSAGAYNVGQDVGDVISLFIGGAEVIRGSGEVAAGLLGSPETGGVSLAVSTKGVVDVTHGSLMATSGAMKLFSRKGRVNENSSNGYSKSSGKNEKHSSLKAKESARQKYQDIKSQYDKLNLKQNKTPEDKKSLKKLENQVKHWKKKQDFTGENHSMNAKGNW